MAEINQGILDDIVNSISETKKAGESFRQEAKANHTNLSLVVKDLNSLVLKNKSSIEESVNQIDGKVREIEEDIAGQIQNIYSEIQKNTAIQQNIINTIYQLDKKIESLMTKGVGGELVKPGSLTERLKTAFGSGAVTPLSPVTTGVAPQTGGQVLGAAGALSLAAIKSGAEYFGITQPEQVRTPAGEQPLPKDMPHAGRVSGPTGETASKGDVPGRPDLREFKDKDLSEKFKLGQERLFWQSGNVSGVDKSLVNVLKAASKDLPPGFRAEMISGNDPRSTGTVNHPNGIAVDMKIYDNKGELIPHDRNSPGWKYYEQLYRSSVIRGKELYPDEKFIWGGAWISHAAGRGDPMHFQIVRPGVGSQTSGRYSFESGLDPSHPFAREGGQLSTEERKEYDKIVRERMAGEKSNQQIQVADKVEKPKPQSQVFLSPKEEETFKQKIAQKMPGMYSPFNPPSVQQVSRDVEKHFPEDWARAKPEFKAELERIAREQFKLRDEENAAKAAAAAKQQPVAQAQAAPQPKPEAQPVQQQAAPQPKPVSEQSIIDKVMSAIGPSSAKAEELPPPKPEEPKPSGTQPPPAKQLEQAAVKKEAAQPEILSKDEKQSLENIKSDRDNNPIPAPPGKSQAEKIDATYFSRNDNWYGGWRERSPYPKNYRVDI